MEGQIGGASTTTKLYEAIIKGELGSFRNLLEQDPLVLDRCIIENSSRGFIRSPLHVAVQMGRLEMVKTLLNMYPSMCLTLDQDGRNPIHVAAIQGRVNMIEVLHEANPHAALETTSDGQTILHLCVKHNQLNALQILLKLANDHGDHLLNAIDLSQNTILHLAVTGKQSEIVEYILAQPKMKKNFINKNDMTAVDIYMKQSRNSGGDKKMEQALKQAKAKPAKNALNQRANDKWYEEQRTSLMLVASLIATVAFQVGVNPPGGLWQEDKPEVDPLAPQPPPHESDHKAGFAIWSYLHHNSLQYFGFNAILVCNTLALLSSLSVVLLLISGFQCKRYFLTVLRVTLWITVTATTLTYGFAVVFLSQNLSLTFLKVLVGCIIGWLLLITFIASGSLFRFISSSLLWQKESIRRKLFSRPGHRAATPTNDHNIGHFAP